MFDRFDERLMVYEAWGQTLSVRETLLLIMAKRAALLDRLML